MLHLYLRHNRVDAVLENWLTCSMLTNFFGSPLACCEETVLTIHFIEGSRVKSYLESISIAPIMEIVQIFREITRAN